MTTAIGSSRRYLVVAAVSILTAAGCGGSGSSITAGQSQNAPLTAVTVSEAQTFPDGSVVQVPAVGVTVSLSTGVNGTTPTGVRATAVTSTAGVVTFTNLPASGQLCVSVAASSLFAASCREPFPGAVTLALSTANGVPGTPAPGNGP
jgi:hypothetical protein